jgi:myosin-7
MIQTLTRAAQARVAYNQMKVGYARLQAVWKAHKLQYKYNKIRNFIIRLQARSRGYLIRNSRFKRNDAVVVIQSYVRGLLARRYHKREMQKNEIQKLPKSEQKVSKQRNKLLSLTHSFKETYD